MTPSPSTLPSISICGVVDFKNINRDPFTHIISIWHPNPMLETFQKQMRVGFPNADIHFATFDDTELSGAIHPPGHTDVLSCIEYAHSIPEGSHLLIHCMAGISRSTATALTIITEFYGPGSERDAALNVQQIRSIANPNRLILKIADDILRRKGAIMNAANSVFGRSIGESNKGW